MTLRSILVLQSTCDDDDESGSLSSDDPSPHPHNKNNSHDDDIPLEEELRDTKSFAWQRLLDSTPVVCDLLLLPEVPTGASMEKTGRDGMVPPQEKPQSRASFQDRRSKTTQKQYEKTTQISPVHLNPCGMDNVLLFNNVQTSNEYFLLSLTSCHYQYEHANGTMVELPVEPVPSTFSFSFTPQKDNEYFFYVPPTTKDADSSQSQQSTNEESPAFAEVFVDFDVSEARRVFQDYQRSLHLGRCLVWPWDSSETCPADEDWTGAKSTLGSCVEGACEDAAFAGDEDDVDGLNDGQFVEFQDKGGPSPTQAVFLEDDGTKPVLAVDELLETNVPHSSVPTPSNIGMERPSTSARNKQSFRVPTLNEPVRTPSRLDEGVRAKSPGDMLLLQELRSRALREEQMLSRILFGMAGLGVVLTVTFLFLFRRVWAKLHAHQLLDPLKDHQRQLQSQAQESDTNDAIDEALASKIKTLTNLSRIINGIEGGYEPNTRTTGVSSVRTEASATATGTDQPAISLVTPRTKTIRAGVPTRAAIPEEKAGKKAPTRRVKTSSPKKATTTSSDKNVLRGNAFLLQLQAARCQKAKASEKNESTDAIVPHSMSGHKELTEKPNQVKTGHFPAPTTKPQPSTPPRGPPASPTKSTIACRFPTEVCNSMAKAEELSPTSKYEQQFFATRDVRRKKKETKFHPLALSGPPLEPASDLPDCTTGSTKDSDPSSTAPPMLKSVVTKKEPTAKADPTQFFSPYSSMPPETKKEKETRTTKRDKQLFVSPFISPIDVSTSSSEDLQDAPSPAPTTGSCDTAFLEDYW